MIIKLLLQKSWFKFLILLVLIGGCLAMGQVFHLDYKEVQAFFDHIPHIISWPLFILGYVFLTFIIIIAKDILKVVGAVIFGPYISTLLIWCAEMINVVILFNLSRTLGRQFVIEKFKISDEQIKEAQEHVEFLKVFAFRSIPLIPFRFLDLGYGLTSIPFSKYFLIAAIASPVRIFWIQFVLSAVGASIFEEGIMQSMGILVDYFIENQQVLMWSFAYLVFGFCLMIVVKFRLKKK